MGNHRKSRNEPRGDATSPTLFSRPGRTTGRGLRAGGSTLYYIYCKAGVTRMGLESLLTYRAIRHLAATHLQQQTLLEVAQVDDSQMVGSQIEVHRATTDNFTTYLKTPKLRIKLRI